MVFISPCVDVTRASSMDTPVIQVPAEKKGKAPQANGEVQVCLTTQGTVEHLLLPEKSRQNCSHNLCLQQRCAFPCPVKGGAVILPEGSEEHNGNQETRMVSFPIVLRYP